MSLFSCPSPRDETALGLNRWGLPAKDKLEQTQDLTGDLTVPNKFPVAFGGFSALLRGNLRTKAGETIDVAVKVLSVENTSKSTREFKRQCREALFLNATEHPSIAKFYGTAVINSRPALVLKWYNNGDASAYLRDRTVAERLTVIRDMASALEHLHGMNIVHGDVKGTNVLITDSGNAVLTDFGLSHFIDIHTKATTSSNSCSIRWLSPELAAIFLGDNGISITIRTRTKESDVWAFGSTAFELLSGTVPYAEIKIPFAITLKIKSGTNPLEASPSTSVEPSTIIPLLRQCWRVRPADRPTMSDIVGLLSML